MIATNKNKQTRKLNNLYGSRSGRSEHDLQNQKN